jgi:hypothetical protein
MMNNNENVGDKHHHNNKTVPGRGRRKTVGGKERLDK